MIALILYIFTNVYEITCMYGVLCVFIFEKSIYVGKSSNVFGKKNNQCKEGKINGTLHLL